MGDPPVKGRIKNPKNSLTQGTVSSKATFSLINYYKIIQIYTAHEVFENM